MQISRHWRLNPQRYRLEGFRTQDGQVSIQQRQQIAAQPVPPCEAEMGIAVAPVQRVLSSVA
jgi:hypothetical protein